MKQAYKVIFYTVILFAIWVVVVVGLDIRPLLIPSFVNTPLPQKINAVLLNVSYSTLAAAIFYLFTVYLPRKRHVRTLHPIISRKINNIYSQVYSIYLEFGRTIGHQDALYLNNAIKNDSMGLELLSSVKEWNEAIPLYRKFKITKTYIQHIHHCYLRIIDVSDSLILHQELLTSEQLRLIDEIRNSSFFTIIDKVATDPQRKLDVNHNITRLFFETKDKILELKNIQENKLNGL